MKGVRKLLVPILLAAVVLALLVVAGSTAVVGRVVLTRISERPVTAPPPQPPPLRDDWRSEIEQEIKSLTLAVAEGIERVSRAENRIQKTVTSARRQVREAGIEHAGIEAEFAELQPPDEEEVEPLQPLFQGMDGGRTVRIPGGTLEIGEA